MIGLEPEQDERLLGRGPLLPTILRGMILAWPLLLVFAGSLAWRRRDRVEGRGWPWFAGWVAAGFLMSFSLVTGFSIGLFLLPAAALALIGAAVRAPHPREASGFAAGIALTAIAVAILHTVFG